MPASSRMHLREDGRVYVCSYVASAWAVAKVEQVLRSQGDRNLIEFLEAELRSDHDIERSFAAFGIMTLAFRAVTGQSDLDGMEALGPPLVDLLMSPSPKVVFPASWGLAWLSDLWKASKRDIDRSTVILAEGWTKKLTGALRRFPGVGVSVASTRSERSG
jgi:hypothetical protein